MKKAALLLLLTAAVWHLKAQTELDSLYRLWQAPAQADSIRVTAYNDYIWKAYLFSKPDTAVLLAEALHSYAQAHNHPRASAVGYTTQGIAHHIQGNYPLALECYEKALAIEEASGNGHGIASNLSNIGILYKDQSDYPRALDYHKKALAIEEEIGDENGVAGSLHNIGIIYAEQGKDSIALHHYERSLAINEAMSNEQYLANNLSRIGNIYSKQGKHAQALEYYEKALAIGEAIQDNYGIAASLYGIGEVRKSQGNYLGALEYCQSSLDLAKEIGVLDIQKSACQCLYITYKSLGNSTKALDYHEQMVAVRDSVYNEENAKKLTRIQMQYEFDKKVATTKAAQEKKDALALKELQRQKLARNGFMGGFAVVLLFAGVFLVQRNKLGKEKKRSEALLLNILPEETAQELKQKGHTEAHLIEQATVLFTDFKGFTALSEQLSPKQLVKDLHECFSAFDRICEKYGIEKIKTIGDSYMAAGGLPTPNATHAQDVVNAALEMSEFVEAGKQKKIANGLPFFEIRLGIHTGPVVAGIVGIKKFQYDIWGDTVNIASRMESSGEVGKVNISQSTYERVQGLFRCEYRGEVAAKGKGKLGMYFASWDTKQGLAPLGSGRSGAVSWNGLPQASTKPPRPALGET